MTTYSLESDENGGYTVHIGGTQVKDIPSIEVAESFIELCKLRLHELCFDDEYRLTLIGRLATKEIIVDLGGKA